jgi:hypothetical protein
MRVYYFFFVEVIFYSTIMNKTDGQAVGQLINNFRFSKSFARENIEFALNYKPENDEKFIVIYTKCGTTWAQQIFRLIHNNGIINKSDTEYITSFYFERQGKFRSVYYWSQELSKLIYRLI